MNETQEALEAMALVKSGGWVPLAAIVIAALIRLSKTDAAVSWWPVYLQPRARAGAALVLGIASGFIAGLGSGLGWARALVGGLVAGTLAITAHEVVVEGIRKGRDIGSPKDTMFPGGTP